MEKKKKKKTYNKCLLHILQYYYVIYPVGLIWEFEMDFLCLLLQNAVKCVCKEEFKYCVCEYFFAKSELIFTHSVIFVLKLNKTPSIAEVTVSLIIFSPFSRA